MSEADAYYENLNKLEELLSGRLNNVEIFLRDIKKTAPNSYGAGMESGEAETLHRVIMGIKLIKALSLQKKVVDEDKLNERVLG